MSNPQASSGEFEGNAKPDPASMRRPEAAAYVAELSAELAAIARRNGLDTLAYLLDMARLEATNAADQARDLSSLPVK